MRKDIKNFLESIKDTKEYFIFTKIFYYPNSILSFDYNFNNKIFYKYLLLLFSDDDFLNRLDSKTLNFMSKLNIKDKLLENKIICEQKIKYTLMDKKIMQKKESIITINNDNYNFPEECLLYQKSFKNDYMYIVDNFFCNNEFLIFVNKKLDIITDKIILSNILDIINGSIMLKRCILKEDWIYSRIEYSLVKEFDLNCALDLTKKINNKLKQSNLVLIKTEN